MKATKLLYEYVCQESQEEPDWDGFLASARKRSGGGQWREMVPCDRDDDYAEFGSDAELMRAVAAVANAVATAPAR